MAIASVDRTQRLVSLDVFRGIAIAFMILVNTPGSWEHIYPPFKHSQWHGCTLTDLVFPCFLFIIGVAMPFSLAKYTRDNRPTPSVYWRIIRRGLTLFGLGLLQSNLDLFQSWLFKGVTPDFDVVRIMGVLQRISLAYVITAFASLHLSRRWLWIFAGIVLVGYWGVMELVPVPGYGAGNLSVDGNLETYIDRTVLGKSHLYFGSFEPEGLLSTFPATVNVIFGYLTGDWLRKQPIKADTSINLVIFGCISLIIGIIWGVNFPINKALWTSSYVFYTVGWALLLLALCYYFIEVLKFRRLGFPFEVMGLNAIFIYIASHVFHRAFSIKQNWIYRRFFSSWAGDWNGSLLFAIAMVLFSWLVLYIMYRRRWFFKL